MFEACRCPAGVSELLVDRSSLWRTRGLEEDEQSEDLVDSSQQPAELCEEGLKARGRRCAASCVLRIVRVRPVSRALLLLLVLYAPSRCRRVSGRMGMLDETWDPADGQCLHLRTLA